MKANVESNDYLSNQIKAVHGSWLSKKRDMLGYSSMDILGDIASLFQNKLVPTVSQFEAVINAFVECENYTCNETKVNLGLDIKGFEDVIENRRLASSSLLNGSNASAQTITAKEITQNRNSDTIYSDVNEYNNNYFNNNENNHLQSMQKQCDVESNSTKERGEKRNADY